MIDKAKIICEKSGNIIDDHFAHVSEMVKIGSSASRVLPKQDWRKELTNGILFDKQNVI